MIGKDSGRRRPYFRLLRPRILRACGRGALIAGAPVFLLFSTVFSLGTFFPDRFPHESFRDPEAIPVLALITAIGAAAGALSGASLRGFLSWRAIRRRHRARFGTRPVLLGRRHLKAASKLAALVLIAAGLWLAVHEYRRGQMRAGLRARYQQAMVDRIRVFLFVDGKMPESWEEFRRSGLAELTPQEVNLVFSLGHRAAELDGVRAATFAAALEKSRGLAPAWAAELERHRKLLRDREGDLKAQLDLFLDPGFEPLAVLPFLDALEKEKGVDTAIIKEFVDANREMRSIHARRTGRADEEKGLGEVRKIIEDLRDEILGAAKKGP